MKRKFEVVGYKTERYTMVVEAESREDAMLIGENTQLGGSPCPWVHDFEHYDFEMGGCVGNRRGGGRRR